MATEVSKLETSAVADISKFLDTHFQPNRVVTLLGPVVAIISGAVASWLAIHFPGLHLDASSTAGTITQGINFAIGALVTLALQHKWLTGWQQYEATQASATSAAAVADAAPAISDMSAPVGTAAPPPVLGPLEPPGTYDPAVDMPTEAIARDPGVVSLPAVPPEGSGTPSDGGAE
jgi:hypothetical protein